MRKSAIILILLLATSANATTWYVSLAGDNSAGTSWSTAFTHPDSLGDNMLGGDTALFGPGNYYNVDLHPLSGNSATDKTVYACSTYSMASANTTDLWGGEVITGWADTTIGGNTVYKVSWYPTNVAGNPSVYEGNNAYYPAIVGDTGAEVLYNTRQSISNLNHIGYAHYNYIDQMLYVWPYSGGNPDVTGETIIGSAEHVFDFYPSRVANVEIFGLNLKASFAGVVLFCGETAGHTDSVSIIHCEVAYNNKGAIGSNNNPGIIVGEGPGAADKKHGNTIRGCNIHGSTGPIESETVSGAGSGILLYGMKNTVIESCYFEQIAGSAVMWKGGDSANTGNTIKFCLFDGTDSMDYGRAPFTNYVVEHACGDDRDSVYGSIFRNITFYGGAGHSNAAVAIPINECQQKTYYKGGDFIAYNTFYNCNLFFRTSVVWAEDIDLGYTPITVKHNLCVKILGASSDFVHELGGGIFATGTDSAYVDSNYWYDATYAFTYDYEGTNHNFTYWTSVDSLGHDQNGAFQSITFDSVDATNMWLGFVSNAPSTGGDSIGGFYFTRAGAVQPATESSPSPTRSMFLK